MRILEWILGIALGLFFIWSGVVKLQDLAAFTEAVGNYQLVGIPWDAVIAYSLPWVEVFAGLAVASGIGRSGGALTMGAMLLVFSGAIVWVWSQGLNINCGCFSQDSEPTNYPMKLLANAGLFLVAIIVGLGAPLAKKMKKSQESYKDLTES